MYDIPNVYDADVYDADAVAPDNQIPAVQQKNPDPLNLATLDTPTLHLE